MISGSLVALVTPMHPDGTIDYRRLGSLIDFHIDQGTDGLVIAGTTGESATLTRSEHIELITRSVDFAESRIPIVAGTGSNSTAQTVDLSVALAGMDVAAYLLVTPYYNKPTQRGLVAHFSAIADTVDQPVILYNVPGRTAVDLLPDTVAQLAEHPRIQGIKEATGEVQRVAQIRAGCGVDFRLYSGDDASSRDFMLAGGDGVISVTANVAPAAMVRLCRTATGGEADQSQQVDEPLRALHEALFLESNPIPVKWALQRMGLIGGGIRLPLTPLSEPFYAGLEAALTAAGVDLI